MDPLTLAAKRFMRDVETFRSPPPGFKAPAGPRLLRVVVDPQDRGNLLKTMRWLEHEPRNQCPVSIVTSDFTDIPSALRGIVERVREDYDAVRAGLAEDGMTIPALAWARSELSIAAVSALLAEAAHGLAQVLGGLFVVIAPERVVDPAAYREFAEQLASKLEARELHVLMTELPDAPIHSATAWVGCFEVDRDALLDYLANLGPKPSSGPTTMPRIVPTKDQKRALRAAGVDVPSLDSARALRRLLLEGGRALADHEPRVAVRKLRAAKMLCHLDRLEALEGAVLLGLGSAYLHTQNRQGALAAYASAKELGTKLRQPTLAAQALLGTAAVRRAAGDGSAARAAYSEIVDLVGPEHPLGAHALEQAWL